MSGPKGFINNNYYDHYYDYYDQFLFEYYKDGSNQTSVNINPLANLFITKTGYI